MRGRKGNEAWSVHAVNTQRASASSRSPLIVEAKQNAKQRQRLSEKQRIYNKARKSAVATRVKKVAATSAQCCLLL